MGKLTSDVVRKTAKLADLPLTDKEIKIFTPQLSEIVDFFEQLKEVNTENVEPTSQTTGLTNVTGADVVDVNRILKVEDAVSGSDNVHNNYFLVPQVIDKDKS